MTQEEKQLLIIELCARLPYRVKGRYCLYDSKGNLTDWGNEPEIVENIDFKEHKVWTDDTVQGYYLDEFKPYLRPMSSMTEEERDEVKKYMKREQIVNMAFYHATEKTYDWYNAHHFDFRGLIPLGLALEAPEGMYKTE